MKQKTFDEEMKEMFGGKVYRLSLSSGCSCPNRDGSVGTGGCIFCSAGGSGEFASPAFLPVGAQIEEAKKKVASKLSNSFAGYMAYFQSFTNTYGPVERLRQIFTEALEYPGILALSIATRPDCLPDEMIGMLAELNRIKPVWVELGLQTVHEDTAKLINRGYALSVFEDAVRRLKLAGLRVVVHVIIGLPGEGPERTKDTIRYLSSLKMSCGSAERLAGGSAERLVCRYAERLACGSVDDSGDIRDSFGYNRNLQQTPSPIADSPIADSVDGIKLQMMQVLKGTKLAEMKKQDPGILHEYSLEEYAALLKELLDILPESVTVHRLTGDPPKNLLISPLWTADKKKVLNTIQRVLQ